MSRQQGDLVTGQDVLPGDLLTAPLRRKVEKVRHYKTTSETRITLAGGSEVYLPDGEKVRVVR